MKGVTVIGIGDDGCQGLSSRAVNAVSRAQILVGGKRHLAFFPQFTGERIAITGALGSTLQRISELADEHTICVLASGDPLFFGIGAKVIEAVGGAHVEVLPYPSSIQWAFARIGLAWEDAAFESVHGRKLDGFVSRLKRQRKVACLTDATNTPAVLAQRLLTYGDSKWQAWVCENVGGIEERVRAFSLQELAACEDLSPLNLLVLLRQPDWQAPSVIPFLHEDHFAKRMPKKGLITKREVRMLSLAALALRPNSVLWDIGAGSGSVSIEGALIAPEGRIYAIEVDPEGVAICKENAVTHGVDNVHVIEGRAPEALAELEIPDAVFIGGSKGSMREIIAVCLERLAPGGRLVVNAITLENISETYAALKEAGLTPEITLLNISRGEPLAHYTRFEALNPIHIFSVQK
jgi:precorrin-6Y C5,15-methyltransferase (decarboxylating)